MQILLRYTKSKLGGIVQSVFRKVLRYGTVC